MLSRLAAVKTKLAHRKVRASGQPSEGIALAARQPTGVALLR